MIRLGNIAVTLGLLMVAAGAVIPVFHASFGGDAYRWIFAAGALLSLIGRIMARPTGIQDLRLRRLYRLEAWSSVFFCVAAAFLLWPGGSARDWVAFTLAGGILMLYTSIAIPRRIKKVG